MRSWLLPIFALIMAFLALAAREAGAQGVDPMPTMSSTNWVAPALTPTLQPWPPQTPTPAPTPDDVTWWRVVWLTEVHGE